jgi:hypothetical protein
VAASHRDLQNFHARRSKLDPAESDHAEARPAAADKRCALNPELPVIVRAKTHHSPFFKENACRRLTGSDGLNEAKGFRKKDRDEPRHFPGRITQRGCLPIAKFPVHSATKANWFSGSGQARVADSYGNIAPLGKRTAKEYSQQKGEHEEKKQRKKNLLKKNL